MTNQTLTLARHAKSSWQTPGLSDHDRPLNKRGERDAPRMAQRLFDRTCIPDLILSSSARRARQTSEILHSGLQLAKDQVRIIPELYLASPRKILQVLAQMEMELTHIMVVAHNPGLEELSDLLAGVTMSPMPTMGVRSFSCHSLQDLYALDATQAMPLSESDTHKPIKDQHSTNSTFHSTWPELIFEDYPKNTA